MASLFLALKSFISSIMPVAKRTTMEKKKQIVKKSFENLNHSRQVIIIARQTAIPPIVGIGITCSFRKSGTSYNLKRVISLISGGINSIAKTNAVTKHSMPTR